jgi:rhodanese-related sulfurtransferase
MANIYGVPEITVHEVAHRMKTDEKILLLDVREEMELRRANLGEGVVWVPLSQMAARRLDALPVELSDDKEQELIVFCHHGVRSAQVAAWLAHEGWNNVLSLAGGIDAYAREIDQSVGHY